MIFTSAYLPPVWYFQKMIHEKEITIDRWEHFVKQTIRNRCHILSANGVQQLIIPVVHRNRTNTPVKDIRIDNTQHWQRQHWRSLNAAYRRSAFFEFYMDDLMPFYEKEYTFLLDLNQELFHFLIAQLGIKLQIDFTETYKPADTVDKNDMRYLSGSGDPSQFDAVKPYTQVFSDRHPFAGGLSIADLLFNTGPKSLSCLGDTI